MRYLGISTLRDHIPNPDDAATWASYIAAAKAGIRFDFVLPGSGDVDLQSDIAHLDAMALAQPDSILAIEAPNEINQWPITYKGISDYRVAGAAVQKDLWSAVKSNRLLNKAAIYSVTLSVGLQSIYTDIIELGNLSSIFRLRERPYLWRQWSECMG